MDFQQPLPLPSLPREYAVRLAQVQSRTFGGDGMMIFTPFIDLVNSEHAKDLQFDMRKSDDGYVELRASRDFEAHEEALVSYHGRQ
eukprot:CAMPEP_0174719786 /NCGR_PEP_ID=MMETSP1094-20130205/31977_1 /TAXON_ID=156173 /ORGANISM="Chrysochromulina brevifilum, Strain UTEX LB 985" /LENGTH=85 /DNA_ID=CAMNT_0015920157 /DNA_START=116 /DNA_END=371 /DNA_ORIENTATION=-